MKDVKLLIWISQLGLSVVIPLAACVFLGVWIRNRFDLGVWPVIAGTVVGILFGIDGLRSSLRLLKIQSEDKKKDTGSIGYNDHI